jgi:hypothetical protein
MSLHALVLGRFQQFRSDVDDILRVGAAKLAVDVDRGYADGMVGMSCPQRNIYPLSQNTTAPATRTPKLAATTGTTFTTLSHDIRSASSDINVVRRCRSSARPV